MTSEVSFKNTLKKYEGLPGTGQATNYMYLDHKQYVTIGYGCQLASVSEAKALKFVHKDNSAVPATDAEIEASYKAVKELTNNNYKASYYESIDSIEVKIVLPTSEIDKLFDKRYEKAINQLRNYFPNYHKYPKPVQFALIDMCFNLGPGDVGIKKGLWGQFIRPGTTFGESVEQRDWQKAAKNSSRRDIPKERNDYVYDLLMQAAVEDKFCPPQIGENEIPKRHLEDKSKAKKPASNKDKANTPTVAAPGKKVHQLHSQPLKGIAHNKGTHPFKHPSPAPNGHGINTDQTGANRH